MTWLRSYQMEPGLYWQVHYLWYSSYIRYCLISFLGLYKCIPWNMYIISKKPLRLLLQNNGNGSMTTPPISFQNKSFVKILNGAVVLKTGCIHKSVIIIYFPFTLLPLLIAWDVLSAFGSECLSVARSQSGSCVAAVPAEEACLPPPTERKLNNNTLVTIKKKQIRSLRQKS